jgi:hypothetical protein
MVRSPFLTSARHSTTAGKVSGNAALGMAAVGLLPAMVTLVLAVTADPSHGVLGFAQVHGPFDTAAPLAFETLVAALSIRMATAAWR